MLRLEGGEEIKHVADFQDLSVKGSLGVTGMKGTVMTTTGGPGGIAVWLGGAGSDTVYLDLCGTKKEVSAVVPQNQRAGTIRFALTIAPERMGFEYGVSKVGQAVKEVRAGKLSLLGGNLGYEFGNLVLSGKPNPEWAKEFFQE